MQIGNGGAISASSSLANHSLTITNCIFNNNICGGAGGAVSFNSQGGTATITGCSFANNRTAIVGANTGGDGGAIATTGGGSGGTYLIEKNTFLNNQVLNVTGHAGAIMNSNGALTVRFNRFIGNTCANVANPPLANIIGQASGTGPNSTVADNNWWGVNTGPGPNDAAFLGGGTGSMTVTKWLQLKTTASPNPICNTATGPGNTSNVTASFLSNSASEAIAVTDLPVLIGLPVTWGPTTLGTLSGQQGTIQSNGIAIALFTSDGTGGTATVNAQVDNVPNSETAPSRASITVNSSPVPTVTNPVTYCLNATASALTATGSNLLWYTTATGGTGSATAPTPLTTSIGTTSYYVSQTVSGCEGPRAQIDVVVNATPTAPVLSSPVTYCQNATASALTATGSNLLWYTTATGGTGSATAPTPLTTNTGTTSYYVSQTVGGCEGPRAQIDVVVNAAPVAPAVSSPVTYCQNATASALTATGSNLLWYTTATGGTGSATAPTPLTTIAGTTSYYVSQTVSGCEGPRAQIDVVVNATPAITSATPGCAGFAGTGKITIVATISSGTIEYSTDNSTWQLSNVFSSLPNGSYTVYARNQAFPNCVTSLTGTIVSCVNPCPTITVTAQNVCSNGSYTFTQSGGATGGVWTVSGGGIINPSTGEFTANIVGNGFTVAYTEPASSTCLGFTTFNVIAAAIAGTDGSTTVCDNSTTPIDLFSLISGEQLGGTWVRVTGSGGTFNAGTGTFTPVTGATNSTFRYIITGTAPCLNDTSVATVILNTISTLTLDGSGSTGTISSYAWTRVSGPNVPVITNPTGVTTTVTGLTQGTYVFQLSLNGGASTSQVLVNVNPPSSPLVSNAGYDRTITLPTTSVTLDGNGSTGTISGYAWTLIAGPNTPGITSPGTVSTTVTGLLEGVYTFELAVTDGSTIAKGTVKVTVNAAPIGSASPVIVSSVTKRGTNNTAVSSLTAVPAGALLVLTVAQADDISDGANATVTSSPALTWTKRADAGANVSGNAEIYTAVFTAGGPITVTAKWAVNLISTALYAITNYDPALDGAAVSVSSQTVPSLAITTTRSNSIIFAVTSDWRAINGTTTRVYRDAATESLYHFSALYYSAYHYLKQTSTAGVYTEGLTAPTGMSAGTCLLEIKGSAAAVIPLVAFAGANRNIFVTTAPTGPASQNFCNAATVANLVATGTEIKWYGAATGGIALPTTNALISGNHYYASQTVNGCESADRLNVTVVVNTTAAPTGNSVQSFCIAATIADLNATGSGIKWYAAPTGGTALISTIALINGNQYFASQTVTGCESQTRLAVTATINNTAAPTGSAQQGFCSAATVAGLSATGTNIKWYAAASGGTALLSTFALVNGNHYYASQTISGCESATRLDVTVTINTTPAPTGNSAQSFCNSATVASLSATGTNIKWYAAPSGGTALLSTVALVNGNHYYASQTINGCENATRLDVTVTILTSGGTSPVIVSSVTKRGTNNTAVSSLTAVPAGALLVLTVAQADDISDGANATVTSSPALTWTKRADAGANVSGNAEIYTAVFTAGGPITVTAKWAVNLISTALYAITNYDPALDGAAVSVSSQTVPSLAITTTRSNSIIFAVTSDWRAINGTTTRVYRDAATESLYHFSALYYSAYHYLKQTSTAGVYTEGLTAPTGMSAGTCLLEIKGPANSLPGDCPVVTINRNPSLLPLAEKSVSTKAALEIYPNPTGGIFNAVLRNVTPGKAMIKVTDAKGLVILAKELVIPASRHLTVVELGSVANGTYFILVIHRGGILTGKVIKE